MNRISVRKLVEFILRNGDIDGGRRAAMDVKAMEKGTMVHRMLQKEGGAAYASEVPLKYVFNAKNGQEILLEGRADGIITDISEAEDGTEIRTFTIDEIKGTYADTEKIEGASLLHMAQAYCYGYMLMASEDVPSVGIRITYINMDDLTVKRFREEKSREELEAWFTDLLEKYSEWLKMQEDWILKRNTSINGLEFPYEYRPGQRKFVAAVYHVIKEKKRLFAQAPTGTGKTIAALFPAIISMGEGNTEKIFYLTAKNLTGTVARKTLEDLEARGLSMKYISFSSKERICFLEEPQCDPVSCPYAKGHFDRINEALFDLVTSCGRIDPDTVREFAERYSVCPYELQMDAAEWMDTVICDYNYLFDPNVSLRRFFSDTKRDYVFLIDEAHNLVDRGRNMFSAAVRKQQFLDLKRQIKDRYKAAAKLLDRINREFLKLKSDDGIKVIGGAGELYILFLRLLAEFDEILKDDTDIDLRRQILDVYFSALGFMNASDMMDDRFIMYTMPLSGNDHLVKILCADPSGGISEKLDHGRSAVFFSATLLPVDYYKDLLSAKPEEDLDMYVDSPFDKSRRKIVVARDVSSRYKRRGLSEYRRIASYIKDIIRTRKGNYLVFFPSYAFMESVHGEFLEMYGAELCETDILVQKSDMTEEERKSFLSAFRENPENTTAGFCVMGGVFSEGIDLVNDRLIGAVIVGTGIPQLSPETDLIKDRFEESGRNGFDYAYRFPGMTKVLQAGGRVIRTSEDTGIIALLDERFASGEYRQLFPREWSERENVTSSNVYDAIKTFWDSMV